MIDKEILHHLSILDQMHLAEGIEALTEHEKALFWEELSFYGPQLLQAQRSYLRKSFSPAIEIAPWEHFAQNVTEEEMQAGRRLLEKGQAACLILAGGQGSRLGRTEPKGTIPVTKVKQKSLFQLFFERILAASAHYQHPLSVAVMTSPSNHRATEEFLAEHRWFGLSEKQVSFVSQNELPFCDEKGDWFLQSPGKLAKGPDGNGNCLRLLYHSEIWEKWKKRGVEYLNVIQVDNALADPFDTGFLGFHAYRKNDASMKCIFRQNETEKVGVIVSFQGKLKVIEYSELSEECGKKDAEGRLLYPLANIGSFCFSMEFIKKHALHSEPLPWHVANKMVQAWDHQVLEGKKKKQAWKFEYFLFDVFEEVQKAAVLVSPRETCYAALKNESGDKSIGTVQEALIAQDRRIFKKITGIEPPDSIFELAPSFSYGSSEQLKKWKAKSWPKLSYIDPSSL